MAIRSVEIICLPCSKCSQLKTVIANIIKTIEMQSKTKILFDMRITPNLQNITNYGLSPAQTPVLLINGIVECAGSVDQGVVKSKLISAHHS